MLQSKNIFLFMFLFMITIIAFYSLTCECDMRTLLGLHPDIKENFKTQYVSSMLTNSLDKLGHHNYTL